jgi:hypothetical protein
MRNIIIISLLLISCTDKIFNKNINYPTYIVKSRFIFTNNENINNYVFKEQEYLLMFSDTSIYVGNKKYTVVDRWRLKTGNNDFRFIIGNDSIKKPEKEVYINFIPSLDRIVWYEVVNKYGKTNAQFILQNLDFYIIEN